MRAPCCSSSPSSPGVILWQGSQQEGATAHVPSALLSTSRSEKARSCGRSEALRESYPQTPAPSARDALEPRCAPLDQGLGRPQGSPPGGRDSRARMAAVQGSGKHNPGGDEGSGAAAGEGWGWRSSELPPAPEATPAVSRAPERSLSTAWPALVWVWLPVLTRDGAGRASSWTGCPQTAKRGHHVLPASWGAGHRPPGSQMLPASLWCHGGSFRSWSPGVPSSAPAACQLPWPGFWGGRPGRGACCPDLGRPPAWPGRTRALPQPPRPSGPRSKGSRTGPQVPEAAPAQGPLRRGFPQGPGQGDPELLEVVGAAGRAPAGSAGHGAPETRPSAAGSLGPALGPSPVCIPCALTGRRWAQGRESRPARSFSRGRKSGKPG